MQIRKQQFADTFLDSAIIVIVDFSTNPLFLEALSAFEKNMYGEEGVFDYIRNINPNATVIMPTQYNPYNSFTGLYSIVKSSIRRGNRGYELASYFKQKGSYIVMGGHHVTLLPDEAAEHADTVMTGPADRIWREFISDYANGTPKKRYDGEHCDIGAANIIPMRELMQKSKYIGVPTVIANFGCTNKCEFCVINSFWGGKHSTRQVEDVIEEIKSLKSKRILFLDPSPTSNRAYAKDFYKALIPLKIQWAGLCTTDVCEDEELFDLMIKSGCIGILMGFETFSEDSLKESHKKNKVAEYKTAVDKFHQNGVSILGTFMLGFDGDTKESIHHSLQ